MILTLFFWSDSTLVATTFRSFKRLDLFSLSFRLALRLAAFLCFLTNLNWFLCNFHKPGRAVLLKDGLVGAFLVGKVDKLTDVHGTLPHILLTELRHCLHILGPGRGLCQHLSGEVKARCSDSGGKPFVHSDLNEGQLSQVAPEQELLLAALHHCVESLEEAVRGRKSHLEVEGLENAELLVQDLLLRVCVIRDVDKVFNLWNENLFILARNEH